MVAKLDSRTRSGHLAKSLAELLESIQAQRNYQTFVLTPRGWHVMWGADGEFYGHDREKIEALCRQHTTDTGMETVVVLMQPTASVAAHLRPVEMLSLADVGVTPQGPDPALKT